MISALAYPRVNILGEHQADTVATIAVLAWFKDPYLVLIQSTDFKEVLKALVCWASYVKCLWDILERISTNDILVVVVQAMKQSLFRAYEGILGNMIGYYGGFEPFINTRSD